MTKRILAVMAAVLLAAVAPATAAAPSQRVSMYNETHVSFDVKTNALVEYGVDGATVMKSIEVQSRSAVESGLGIDLSLDLSVVTNIAGATLSIQSSATTSTHATITTESGAILKVHDNGHGSLVVVAEENAQVLTVGLTTGASAEQKSDSRVVVTNDDGSQVVFIVAGEGTVTVNEDGNVSASIAQGSRLVVRSYTEARTSADKKEEQLIANGTIAASVHLMASGGETVTDVVNYGYETTVEITARSANHVEMTVSRSANRGKIVLVSMAKGTFETAENIRVMVDGEAAVRASSYASLKQTVTGGSTSKYMVVESSSANASTTVAVALNHFSSRDVTITSNGMSTDGSDGTSNQASSGNSDEGASGADVSNGAEDGTGVDSGASSGTGPGFGVVGTVVAIAGVVGIGLWRRS